jgi:kynureninase
MNSDQPAAHVYPDTFEPGADFALRLDAGDPLRSDRDRFHLPRAGDGKPLLYLCSHSLGLQPRAVEPLLTEELGRWADLAVEGHFHGQLPWYTYPDSFREAAARLVGARTEEVVHMNGLTVNLHLLMLTFFQPRGRRTKILVDEPTFPSDRYAVLSQLRRHGLDPETHLLTIGPRPGEDVVRTEDVEALLEQRGQEIALVLLNGLNFLTGQLFDMARLTAAARRAGCVVGYDLAHAVGNVPLCLHDWQVDFAVWCTYKYLCSGPGAVAGCFVHEMHGRNLDLPRLAGWWGNDPATRFRMQLQAEFIPQPGAGGWQVSNPPVLALVPLRAALALFDEVGMPSLRARSACLTGYLQYLLDRLPAGSVRSLTPRDPGQRGAQLSMQVRGGSRQLLQALREAGVVADFREPDVLRVAPAPMYNTFSEVYQFAQILGDLLGRP